MISGLREHLHVLQHTLQRLLSTPLSSALNILVIGIALSLPTGIYVALLNLERVAGHAASTPQLSIFMNLNASRETIARFEKQLQQLDAIKLVTFVPREQALAQLKLTTGLSDVISGLKNNPLPDAFIIHPQQSDSQSLESLRDALRNFPQVDHVQLDSAWAHKLEALIRFANLVVLLISVLLSLALVAITFNTIRLQILTQQDEIEVSNLIGATQAFIRRPFLYFGLLQGLLGGMTAWLMITASLTLLNNNLADLATLYASNFALQALTTHDSLTLLLFSASLGWLGAWLSVTLHSRNITTDQ